jgi:hypothetical protein
MLGMAPPVANDEYALLRHLRSSALIYCLIGFGVMCVSLGLLLGLWFANGYLYWCGRRFSLFLTDLIAGTLSSPSWWERSFRRTVWCT